MRRVSSFVALLALVACTGGPTGPGGNDTASDTATTDTGRGVTDTGTTADTGTTTDTATTDTGTTDTGTADTGTAHNACTTTDAVVTDIDATLTTSDNEWIQEIFDPTHDPAMRPDANTLMQGYAAKGYAIFYVTARGADLPLSGGRDVTTVTTDWLTEHDFPDADSNHIFLSSGIGAFGNGAETYKAQVIETLQSQGYVFDWGYGNATTDIAAYRDAGMSDSTLFMVGDLAGQDGVTGISTADAYTNFLPFLDSVTPATCPE